MRFVAAARKAASGSTAPLNAAAIGAPQKPTLLGTIRDTAVMCGADEAHKAYQGPVVQGEMKEARWWVGTGRRC